MLTRKKPWVILRRERMRLSFCSRGVGDANEFCLCVKFLEIARADVAHADLDSGNERCDDICERALIRHKCFDAFGDCLSAVRKVALLPCCALDDGFRAHTAVLLELFAIFLHNLSWCFVRASKKISKHDSRGPSGERFCDVA